jgi:hypothetical protein
VIVRHIELLQAFWFDLAPQLAQAHHASVGLTAAVLCSVAAQRRRETKPGPAREYASLCCVVSVGLWCLLMASKAPVLALHHMMNSIYGLWGAHARVGSQ